MMNINNKTFKLFIPETDIRNRILDLASDISTEYQGKDPLFIAILNGAFLFASDLIKEISIPCMVSFVKSASYAGTQSTGNVKCMIGLNEPVKDRHVIVLDDIVDTGLTMACMLEDINKQQPASVSVATLLLKPESFADKFDVRYVGFTIPNNFVVGYGLDYDGYGRNLKDIYTLGE